MKLADIDIDELVHALGMERSVRITVASEEGRKHTEAERLTMCMLAAFERAVQRTAASSGSRVQRG